MTIENEVKDALLTLSLEEYAIFSMQVVATYTALLSQYPLQAQNDKLARVLMSQAVNTVKELNGLIMAQNVAVDPTLKSHRYTPEEIERAKGKVALRMIKYVQSKK